ncbi:MAG: RepB family DNA primase [Silvibacterium sp.]
MQQFSSAIQVYVAYEFLTLSFAPGETLAILLRGEYPVKTQQRIVRFECAIAPRYLRWLAYENARGANIYVAANPLRFGSRKRTKESIDEVRHLYIDIDSDGDVRLVEIRTSDRVPIPSTILSTSPGKYQVLWQVDDFRFAEQERLLKLLATAFGGDPACTDCNRVLRLPGFLNNKYDPVHPVTAEYPSNSVSKPEDFRLDDALIDSIPIWPGKPAHNAPSQKTNSENDWAWIARELAAGKDAVKLTRMLAECRSDKPNPLYYAQRTVDGASARLWLLEGIAFCDIVTMLEVRRRFEIPSTLNLARAHEIARTAQHTISRQRIA